MSYPSLTSSCCAAGYDEPPIKLKSAVLGGLITEISHSAGVHREADRDSDLSQELSQKLSGTSRTELFSKRDVFGKGPPSTHMIRRAAELKVNPVGGLLQKSRILPTSCVKTQCIKQTQSHHQFCNSGNFQGCRWFVPDFGFCSQQRETQQ